MKNDNLAAHHHVELMLNAKKETVLVLVLVCQNILEIHILVVDQNVFKTQIVTVLKHVKIISAKILVQEYVALMLNVGCKTTHLYAFA